MQVTNVTARIMQRVQIRDYEPKEAEATISAILEDGDDYEHALATLMHDASVAVTNGIKGKPVAKPAAAEEVEDKPKKATKTTKAKKSDDDDLPGDEDEKPSKPAKAEKKSDDDLPDEDEKPSKPAKAEKKAEKADDDDLPGDEGDAGDAGGDEVWSATELQKYITNLINGKKITVAQVKEVMAEFKIGFTRETTDENRMQVKARIDEVVAGSDEEI